MVMIAFIRGVVEHLGFDVVTVTVGGVGYGLHMSIRDVSSLSKGQEVELFVAEIIREQSYDLYAFTNEKDKKFFDLILKVSGVGPRIALALVSIATIDEIALAIQSSNIALLTSTPGVGKRLAERIVVELKDKISLSNDAEFSGLRAVSKQAEDALLALGFRQNDVDSMLKNVDTSSPIEEQVRQALRRKK